MLELTFDQLRKFAEMGLNQDMHCLKGITEEGLFDLEIDLADQELLMDCPPVKVGDYVFEKLSFGGYVNDLSSVSLMGTLAEGRIFVWMHFDNYQDAFQVNKDRILLVNEDDSQVIVITSVNFSDDRIHDDDDVESHATTMASYETIRTPAIVIDLETLATDPNAVITEIGAVFGDLHTGKTYGFFRELVDEVQSKRTTDIQTVNWHRELLKKNKLIRTLWHDEVGDGNDLLNALVALTTWISPIVKAYPDIQVITNGPEFDAAILATAYAQYGAKTPWEFRSNQSLRTYRAVAEQLGVTGPADEFAKRNTAMTHNALYDAWREFNIAAYQHKAIIVRALPKQIGVTYIAPMLNVMDLKDDQLFYASLNSDDVKQLAKLGMPKRASLQLELGDYTQPNAVCELLDSLAVNSKVCTVDTTYYRTPRGLWFAF
jgi:hypothetical protein